MESIETYLQTKAQRVNEALRRYMENWSEVPDILREASSYSLLAGGKRLRPILTIAACEAVGGEEAQAMPFACAIEMIHTYSLIHDDLPAMDDDDYRRGRLTNHKVYGEAMAVLAGDALLTKAFAVFAEAARRTTIPAGLALRLLEEAAIRAGAEGMVGGQAEDMLSEDQAVPLEKLEAIHRHKTGDLIVFSVRAGAMAAGAKEEDLQAMTTFAEKIGLAFQIQDDVLDVIGDREKMGKATGSDEAKQKSTYPALLGLDASQEWMNRLAEEAKQALTIQSGIDECRLVEIADYLTKRDR